MGLKNCILAARGTKILGVFSDLTRFSESRESYDKATSAEFVTLARRQVRTVVSRSGYA